MKLVKVDLSSEYPDLPHSLTRHWFLWRPGLLCFVLTFKPYAEPVYSRRVVLDLRR
jgi:hypothetical protein